MSKYEPLWEWVGKQTAKNLTLTFAEIQQILDFPIDHSFLNVGLWVSSGQNFYEKADSGFSKNIGFA